MKVEFIKNHVLGKIGSVQTLPKPKANYLIRCGVVKVYKAPKPKKAKTTKATKATKETE